MSAAIVTEIGSLRVPGLPPILARKLVCFLSAEMSGVIELQVHQGRISGYKITESGRLNDPAFDVDRNGHEHQD